MDPQIARDVHCSTFNELLSYKRRLEYSMMTTRARTTPGVGSAVALVLSDLALMGTSLL